jgi:hypothetical protein
MGKILLENSSKVVSYILFDSGSPSANNVSTTLIDSIRAASTLTTAITKEASTIHNILIMMVRKLHKIYINNIQRISICLEVCYNTYLVLLKSE